ncbi:MAG: hypothetical protein CTY31_08190 [Hyphomicrobium sp.]|nr:MAG: hypothetical protein CTY39_01310 [Hyphomicrobium sp.]PPC99861.1 MAG: hypothetical protein CTY31_08190 [Hyphomicrobium sp.]
MQRLDSTSLVLVGVGFVCAWLATESQKSVRTPTPTQEAVRILGAPERDLRITMSTLPRTFSAQAPLLPVQVEPEDPDTPVKTIAAATKPALHKSEPKAAASALPWRTVVLADPAASSARALTSSKAGDVETRAKLTRDLQQELKRVGCYGGYITGAWTASTKRAMWAFMDRINGSLPVDEPDYILLTLVQGHSGMACGADCKAGEVMSASGRCLPQAVVAQAAKKSKSAQRTQEKIRHAQARRDQVVKRYADDHVAAKTAASARRVATIDTRRPSTPPGAAETLPWLKDDQIALAPQADRRAPLPGRMSVGAPLPIAADRSAAVAVIGQDGRPRVISDTAPDYSAESFANTSGVKPLLPAGAVRPDEVAAIDLQPADAVVDGVLIQEPPKLSSGRKAGYRPARAKRSKYSYSSGKKRRRGYRGPGRPVNNIDEALRGYF